MLRWSGVDAIGSKVIVPVVIRFSSNNKNGWTSNQPGATNSVSNIANSDNFVSVASTTNTTINTNNFAGNRRRSITSGSVVMTSTESSYSTGLANKLRSVLSKSQVPNGPRVYSTDDI